MYQTEPRNFQLNLFNMDDRTKILCCNTQQLQRNSNRSYHHKHLISTVKEADEVVNVWVGFAATEPGHICNPVSTINSSKALNY